MILLHLDIDETGQAAFRADAPSPFLLEAVQSVVWFKDETALLADGRVATSTRNLLMFLSDVRGRKFKRGIFLGDDILQLAETFRAAARTVAAGQFLPDLEERPDGFHAVWHALGVVKGERRKVKDDVESDHPSPFTLHPSPFTFHFLTISLQMHGMVIHTMVPFPNSDFRRILPPISFTTSWQIARPSPLLPLPVVTKRPKTCSI